MEDSILRPQASVPLYEGFLLWKMTGGPLLGVWVPTVLLLTSALSRLAQLRRTELVSGSDLLGLFWDLTI